MPLIYFWIYGAVYMNNFIISELNKFVRKLFYLFCLAILPLRFETRLIRSYNRIAQTMAEIIMCRIFIWLPQLSQSCKSLTPKSMRF